MPAGRRRKTRQNAGIEKIADVLEEIWRTADRRIPIANLGPMVGHTPEGPSCAGPH